MVRSNTLEKIIEVINLKKIFKLSKKQQKINQTKEKEKIAVNDLSFSVNKGEIYGLLGSNGAGKTTTLRMIATLIKPTSGVIYVNDLNVVKDSHKVRTSIGFLTSDLKLEDFFTPSYLYNFYSDLHQIPVDVREERKKALFKTFDIESFSEIKVGELSTGMKQKASLAISLVHDPQIIIFDEPTNGLDVLTAKVVTDYLLELKEKGYTIIISTHIFSLVEKVCDRYGIIIDGKMHLEKDVISGENVEQVFFDVYNNYYGGAK